MRGLHLFGKNNFGGNWYTCPGWVELHGVEVAALNHGDMVTDLDGEGRTIYIHVCTVCQLLPLERGSLAKAHG